MGWVDVPTDPPEPVEYPSCSNCNLAVELVGLDFGGICTLGFEQTGDINELRYVDWFEDACYGYRRMP